MSYAYSIGSPSCSHRFLDPTCRFSNSFDLFQHWTYEFLTSSQVILMQLVQTPQWSKTLIYSKQKKSRCHMEYFFFLNRSGTEIYLVAIIHISVISFLGLCVWIGLGYSIVRKSDAKMRKRSQGGRLVWLSREGSGGVKWGSYAVLFQHEKWEFHILSCH